MYSHPKAVNQCWKKHLDRQKKQKIKIHSWLSMVAYSLMPISLLFLFNCSCDVCTSIGCY
jgi:hypothetical protein